jgi:hypothetical protein
MPISDVSRFRLPQFLPRMIIASLPYVGKLVISLSLGTPLYCRTPLN